MSVDPLIRATAVEAVLRAGAIQLAHFRRDVRIERKSSSIDLVTQVDLEVEREFRARIAERFPDHRVLGEEFSGDVAAVPTTGPCWVFDPLDGTTNYAHGLPIFSASLGFEVDGEAVLGAVFDPTRQELFVAERDKGATLNGQPIHVSAAATLDDSMLCTGFPYDIRRTRDEVVGLFSEFVGRCRAVRRLGSAALDLCYVASGRFDGFWESGLKPWDTAAGALVVREAGGRVSRLDGGDYQSRSRGLVASNGAIHEEMLAVIREFADRRARQRTD
jgi:myo-inositol-1(or 4)-monophosphatase